MAQNYTTIRLLQLLFTLVVTGAEMCGHELSDVSRDHPYKGYTCIREDS